MNVVLVTTNSKYGFEIIITGFGFSLCNISTLSIVPMFFEGSTRLVCLGFVTMGTGVGAMIFPALLHFLVDIYTWRGALLITSGIVFQMCISAALSTPSRDKKAKEQGTTLEKDSSKGIYVKNEENGDENIIQKKEQTSVYTRCVSIIKNKIFLLFALSMTMAIPCMNSILIFMIDFYQTKGIEKPAGVSLYVYMNLASLPFRMLPGAIARISKIPKMTMPCIFVWLAAVDIFMFPFASVRSTFTLLACVYGACLGAMVNLIAVTTFQLTGPENYSTAIGILFTLLGVAKSVAGPISGKCFQNASVL